MTKQDAPTTTDAERAEFEAAWMARNLPKPSRSSEPGYTDTYELAIAQNGWVMWQAARASSAAALWLPIETAPRDGTYLLLWEMFSDHPFIGYWRGGWRVSHEHVDAEGGWDGANVVDAIDHTRVTHWHPLVAKPADTAPKETQ